MASSSSIPVSRGTLLTQLCTEPPKLEDRHPVTSDRSLSSSLNWPKPDYMLEWKDFSYSDLESACNGLYTELLSTNVKLLDFDGHITQPVVFTAEQSLECFFHKWTHTIVSFALKEAQENSEKIRQPYIAMKHGCDTKLKEDSERINQIYASINSLSKASMRSKKRKTAADSNPSAQASLPSMDISFGEKAPSIYSDASSSVKNKKKIPDWAGVLQKPGRTLPLNILPGDTKLSRKWTSSEICTTIEGNPRWAWPIRQILNYCLRAQARYGYIITDKEMVVMRVSRAFNAGDSMVEGISNSGKGITMEYKSIPYTNSSSGQERQLTVNLALWWLHLLAANGHNISAKYPSLKNEIFRPREDRIDSRRSSTVPISPSPVNYEGIPTSSMSPMEWSQTLGSGTSLNFSSQSPEAHMNRRSRQYSSALRMESSRDRTNEEERTQDERKRKRS